MWNVIVKPYGHSILIWSQQYANDNVPREEDIILSSSEKRGIERQYKVCKATTVVKVIAQN